ncbi:MAG: alpha-glucan family phosphorylase, partial [Chitinophagaceae bacterium]
MIRSEEIYGLLPFDIEGVALLAELALDLSWSWNHSTDQLWEKLDPALWELTRNPWVILQSVSHEQLERQLADPLFRQLMNDLKRSHEKVGLADKWFQTTYPLSHLKSIVYFSMEYMLSEALPVYVGGLGNVAGDQLKSANDLGVPITAIGLLYQRGYFRQYIDEDGAQKEYFPYNDPGSLPVMPLRLPNGEWLRVKVALPGYPVWVRAWQALVGNLKLYLLDSNDPVNLPIHRGITGEIYGDGAEIRIKQEMILGIGGWKVLEALNLSPEVCHLNEGHSAFAVLERASAFMKSTGLSFEDALTITRCGNIFTTHTLTSAGFDKFSPSLMSRYFQSYVTCELKIGFDNFLALGRSEYGDKEEPFNMALLAMRGSGFVNAVSKRHCEMSRKLFCSEFKRWPINEIPIDYVTNGIHVPTWDSKIADTLWTQACGKNRWRKQMVQPVTDIKALTNQELWTFRNESRIELVKYVREKFVRGSKHFKNDQDLFADSQKLLNENHLTLGFARRFVPYKRTNLLLNNPLRLLQILNNRDFPVQLVIAGKASPYDKQSK